MVFFVSHLIGFFVCSDAFAFVCGSRCRTDNVGEQKDVFLNFNFFFFFFFFFLVCFFSGFFLFEWFLFRSLLARLFPAPILHRDALLVFVSLLVLRFFVLVFFEKKKKKKKKIRFA